MPIRFPKMHIAQSVVNQILNAHDEIERSIAPPVAAEPREAPDVADPTLEGAMLDTKLQQPVSPDMPPPTDGPNGPAVNTLEATLSGGTPLNGLLDGISTG